MIANTASAESSVTVAFSETCRRWSVSWWEMKCSRIRQFLASKMPTVEGRTDLGRMYRQLDWFKATSRRTFGHGLRSRRARSWRFSKCVSALGRRQHMQLTVNEVDSRETWWQSSRSSCLAGCSAESSRGTSGPKMGMKIRPLLIDVRARARVQAAGFTLSFTNHERERRWHRRPQFVGISLDEASCLRSHGSLTTRRFSVSRH